MLTCTETLNLTLRIYTLTKTEKITPMLPNYCYNDNMPCLKASNVGYCGNTV